MSLFFRSRVTENRALSYQDVWGSGGDVNAIGGPGVVAGGLRLIPVYSATSLIADLVSTAPLTGYEMGADGIPRRQAKQPQLVVNPSPFGTRIDWLHQATASLLLRGNAYGYVVKLDSRGRPSQIVWFNPDDVTVYEEQNDWFHTPQYWWRGRPLDPTLLVHIPAYTFPGSVVGFSPLALFKLQIETGMQAQSFGSNWFKNGSVPSVHLKNVAKTLTSEQATGSKERFKSAVTARDVFVTGNDWDVKALSVNANESQFLETIKASATQIAAIYRVSPEDVGGEVANSLTYKTLEQDNTKLTQRAIRIWCCRLAEALNMLTPDPEFVAFDLDSLAAGDKTSRMIAHAAALASGIETNKEARAMENKPPLTDEEIKQWQEWYRGTVEAPPVPVAAAGKDGSANA